jgi:hypothetical protein
MCEGHFDDLLEYLTFKTGCMYMSDLPYCRWRLPSAIRNIPENRYPVTAWDEAVAYIYRFDKRFKTVKEAKEFILSWSSKSEIQNDSNRLKCVLEKYKSLKL